VQQPDLSFVKLVLNTPKVQSKIWIPAQLIWRAWTDEILVYNVQSGNTHVLNPMAAQVLDSLQRHPGTVPQVSQKIAADSGVELDDELVSHVERLVADLDELGLVLPLS
jgi:PqqD family protein of HPr-rel-A system